MLLPNLANEELARFSIMVFGMSRISFFLVLFGVLKKFTLSRWQVIFVFLFSFFFCL